MTASARAHPSRNSVPFTLACDENSIKITAMIGTGLIATPIAKVRIAPTASHMLPPPLDCSWDSSMSERSQTLLLMRGKDSLPSKHSAAPGTYGGRPARRSRDLQPHFDAPVAESDRTGWALRLPRCPRIEGPSATGVEHVREQNRCEAPALNPRHDER
jgi:hypothetical protein